MAIQKTIKIKNKKARFEYEILDKFVAGIVLQGTEIKAIRDFDFTRDVSLNVGVLLRGANEITVAKINEVLKHLLDNNIIQNIYASYGIEYVSPK